MSNVIPFAGRKIIMLKQKELAAIARCVRLVDSIAHQEDYAKRVDQGAGPTARFLPGNRGVMMGYDFHLTAEGPRLIEINTNAGGGLLNAIHSQSLCAAECAGVRPPQEMEALIVESFREDFAAVRGPAAQLRRIAIVDENPSSQFLYPEFALFVGLFARAGIEAQVVDTEQLDPAAFDMVYWRDTDFSLETPRAARLRQAYLEGSIVVSPSPREHHLIAHKGRMSLFSSVAELAALGCSQEDARFLMQTVPETRPLSAFNLQQVWDQRRQWVFKPAARYGGKSVYRGDKITRGKFAEIAADPAFLAQRRVEPGVTEVETPTGPERMKFDLRAYAYRGDVLMLGARVYQGQITNFRSRGGGFSGICVAA